MTVAEALTLGEEFGVVVGEVDEDIRKAIIKEIDKEDQQLYRSHLRAG